MSPRAAAVVWLLELPAGGEASALGQRRPCQVSSPQRHAAFLYGTTPFACIMLGRGSVPNRCRRGGRWRGIVPSPNPLTRVESSSRRAGRKRRDAQVEAGKVPSICPHGIESGRTVFTPPPVKLIYIVDVTYTLLAVRYRAKRKTICRSGHTSIKSLCMRLATSRYRICLVTLIGCEGWI